MIPDNMIRYPEHNEAGDALTLSMNFGILHCSVYTC